MVRTTPPTTPPATTPPAATTPTLAITSPAAESTVTGPKVKVVVEAKSFTLAPAAGATVKAGEGHLHFFVDSPASAIAAGQVISSSDSKYVHAGAPLLTERKLDLIPGQHTITMVAGDAGHTALASSAPQTIMFTMK